MQSNITIPHSYVVSVTSDFIEDAPHSAFDVPLRRYQNHIRRVTKKPKKDFDVQHLAHRYARQAPDTTLLMTATIRATPLIRPGHPAYLVWAEWSEKQENLVSENSGVEIIGIFQNADHARSLVRLLTEDVVHTEPGLFSVGEEVCFVGRIPWREPGAFQEHIQVCAITMSG